MDAAGRGEQRRGWGREKAAVPGADWLTQRWGRSLAGSPQTAEAPLCVSF